MVPYQSWCIYDQITIGIRDGSEPWLALSKPTPNNGKIIPSMSQSIGDSCFSFSHLHPKKVGQSPEIPNRATVRHVQCVRKEMWHVADVAVCLVCCEELLTGLGINHVHSCHSSCNIHVFIYHTNSRISRHILKFLGFPFGNAVEMMACKNKKSLGVICMAHHFIMIHHALIFLGVSTTAHQPGRVCNRLKKVDELGCSRSCQCVNFGLLKAII